MAGRTWITCPGQYVYQRPYEDAWGTLHDPTTEWDELLKNYKPWVMLLQVGEGTRRMAQPAAVGAGRIIQKEQRRQRSMTRLSNLEAAYLEKTHSTKYWKRRQRRKTTLVGTASDEVVVSGA